MMFPTARDNYLATEVRTASAQKIQLLLIEAALRHAELTRQHWQAKDDDRAIESVVRAQEIVSELIAGLNHESGGELVRRVSAIYNFVLRRLIEAGYQHNEKSLADAVRVLEIERETWRQICQKEAPGGAAENPALGDPGPVPAPPTFDDLPLPVGGFSLEA